MTNTTNAGPVLPELPTPDGEARTAFGVRSVYLRQTMIAYAHQYAEYVAGPMREELAQVRGYLETLTQRCVDDTAENGVLREALSECATAVGGAVSPNCSVEFLREVPREVELVVAKLRERVAELEDCLRKSIGIADRLRETRDDLKAELDRLRAECEALSDSLRECADDLESEVKARASGDLPRRIERDLEPARRARELLAARAAREG
jgi:predicted RNase H-like nuclease (RuvC/YqgF family)